MKLLRNKDGNFTIEASLVFPVIFFTLLLLLFFCMYLYHNAVLGHTAFAAAERSAYVWDNSYREPKTGAYEDDQHDSLYWRIHDDGMLQLLFGSFGGNSLAVLELPGSTESSGNLPLKKLGNIGRKIPAGMEGQMKYDNRLLFRKVSVTLHRNIPLAPLETVIGDVRQAGHSASYIVEPVEWIRTVELVRYYGARFKGTGKEHVGQADAGKALKLYAK
ncbi:TadE/TadG family type IV pilus assembly protein [Paenibacillus woosongensis]|uniref:TadE/TadG family type IV pilus assembly protein n=1 Tax=Paenibacillus woosongensis TaxID=307580 RepID=A0AA95ICM1_9BACL|nr:TadE/TadG family type IV pilus assembly protein [Paenibacillus woosongensis]WHX50420.1 TadE/TadG family type IV pilus assembly protein [Paenibacillus woosongensis]